MKNNNNQPKLSSRVYGPQRFTEAEAYKDLEAMKKNYPDNMLQYYIDGDATKGVYYACITFQETSQAKPEKPVYVKGGEPYESGESSEGSGKAYRKVESIANKVKKQMGSVKSSFK